MTRPLSAFLKRLIWLCMAPLLLLSGWLAWTHLKEIEARHQREAANLARNFAVSIDSYLESRLNALNVLAVSPLVDDPRRWPDLYAEAQGFRESFGAHVAFADQDRQMLFNTRKPYGTALPPLWHWIYFLEGLPPGELGRDGHPARGGFLPPVPLPNRMWAGGRVAFLAPVPIGARVRKVSRILKVDHKVGRSGDLVFVTVLHEVGTLSGDVLVREEHDIVYKSASRPSRPAATTDAPAPAPFEKRVTPTSTTLFRYSALTFNGHRIHYDQDYCREVEGYANLVIHGPLVATLLAGFAEEASGHRLREFNYRGVSPALLGETITLGAAIDGDQVWLPKSQIEMSDDCPEEGDLIEVDVPDWLAEEKGLL